MEVSQCKHQGVCMAASARCAYCLQDDLKEMEKEFRQVAQEVHQAYHTEHAGTWQQCPKNVCSRVRLTLQDLRLLEKEGA